MDDKSFYYVSSWDDAAVFTRALESMGIPHAVEAPGKGLPIAEGELAIVFPQMSSRQYHAVRELFGDSGITYPHT